MNGMNKIQIAIIFGFFLAGCSSTIPSEDDALKQKAGDLAQKYIIVDGHVDLPWRLTHGMENVSGRTEKGDFDYIRAKEGGLDAPFMSIYIPSSYQKAGGAKAKADSLIDLVEGLSKSYPDKYEVALSPNDIERIKSSGKIALPMGMENGAPIESDLSNLDYFYHRGIRYITLTHAKDNEICDSSYDTTRTWKGLSPFGVEVVKKMNQIGIMVDISHVSDHTFYQVMELTRVPVIASHSSCRKFTPGFERNMSDDMIKKLGENGGVIMINYGSTFLRAASAKKSDDNWEKIKTYAKENGLKRGDKKYEEYYQKVVQENPHYADVSDVADHIDHVVSLIGTDHVGLGSDFDGVGDSLPHNLKDASHLPNLIYHLLKRGYSNEDIRKICYGNIFRVWKIVESAAKKSS